MPATPPPTTITAPTLPERWAESTAVTSFSWGIILSLITRLKFSGVRYKPAAARIDASDRARAGYLRRSYDGRWDDPDLYDLILNTARLTVESAVDLLCLAAQQATPAVSAVRA